MERMMIRFLLALLALLLPIAAQAQSFPKPSDVAAYVPVTPLYEAGTTPNLPLDPNVTPPPQAGLADIPSTTSDQLNTGHSSGDGGFKLTSVDGGPGAEAKFRTHVNCTKIAYTDPVRNFGQQGASHLHQFFGNAQIDDFSTFPSLRAKRRSLAGGGDMNATGYWFPAPIRTNPFGDGKNYSPKCKYVVVYYFTSPALGRPSTKLRLALRYVSGADMDDPNKEWLKAYIAAANAQPGTSGRYRIDNNLTGVQSNDFSWKCQTSGGEESHPYLKDENGNDPWEGRCVAGNDMALTTHASNCWDGVNLWSPGGYKHVIQGIWDTRASAFVCPKNYYRLPTLLLTIWFEHEGFSDYGNWRLSSDDMMQATLTALGTPRAIRNGESAHFDWMNGWDGATLDAWQSNCIGAENGTPHECNDGRISATTSLKRGEQVHVFGSSPTQYRNPQVVLTDTGPTISSPNGRFLIPASPNGPHTIHVH